MKSGASVYILEAECGRVKIGCSSTPFARFYVMSANSPCEVRMVAVLPGGHAEERALHKRFASHRVYREWFHLRGDLAEFVESVRGRGVSDKAPKWAAECFLPEEERQHMRALRGKETRRINDESKKLLKAAYAAMANHSQPDPSDEMRRAG